MECRHTFTQGREGETGSWCVDCGVKVYELETRHCKDCVNYFESLGRGGCKKLLMSATPLMLVTYRLAVGTCWTPIVSRKAVIGDRIRTTYPFLNGNKVTMTLDTQDMVDDINAVLQHNPCAWELL